MPRTRSDRSPSPSPKTEHSSPDADARDQYNMLQDQIAELQQQLTDLKLRQGPTPADHVSAPNSTVVSPEPFSDGAKNLIIFLSQCRNAFNQHPSQFQSEEQKVVWAGSYLSGPAFRWYHLSYVNGDDQEVRDFKHFADALTELYGDPNLARSNVRKLQIGRASCRERV